MSTMLIKNNRFFLLLKYVVTSDNNIISPGVSKLRPEYFCK